MPQRYFKFYFSMACSVPYWRKWMSRRLWAEFINISASWVWLPLWNLKCFDAVLVWEVLVCPNHFNCFNSYFSCFVCLFGCLLHRRHPDRHHLWPVLFGMRRNDPLWAPQTESIRTITFDQTRHPQIQQNVCLILCHFSLPVHDIWLFINSTLIFFLLII